MVNTKYNNIFTNIFLFTFSIILGITACEILGRVMGLGDPVLYYADSLIGYRLKPNQKVKRFKNSYITVNNEGFRVASLKNKNSSVKNVVFVGDSVTYGGSYINDNDLFSELFCESSIEDDYCLNGAINSWGLQNMGRFISNFNIYSKLKPNKFILVILPGDEYRNLRSFSDTPYWSNKPKNPKAINEILRFIILKHINPKLESKGTQQKEIVKVSIEKINQLQKKIAWQELQMQLKNSKYPVDIVITPPKRWFTENENYKKEIKTYDNFLKSVSNLKNVINTCNLYYQLEKDYESSFYVDGVHLSNEGHEAWANKINFCLG